MKLYIKEKVFSWGDKFTVRDVYGNDKYIVEGEMFTWGRNSMYMTWRESEPFC